MRCKSRINEHPITHTHNNNTHTQCNPRRCEWLEEMLGCHTNGLSPSQKGFTHAHEKIRQVLLQKISFIVHTIIHLENLAFSLKIKNILPLISMNLSQKNCRTGKWEVRLANRFHNTTKLDLIKDCIFEYFGLLTKLDSKIQNQD